MDRALFRIQQRRVLDILEQLGYTCTHFTPEKRDLRWFGVGRYEAQISMLCKGISDAHHHAAALIGYFEGYEQRGAFQLAMPPCVLHRDIHVAMGQLSEMNELVTSVLMRFDHESVQLHPEGPKIPGPIRTLEAAEHHLQSLHIKLVTILLALIRKPHKQEALRKRLVNIQGAS